MQQRTIGLLTFGVLGLAATMGALCFDAVAQAKGIHDARAMQVSTFYTVQLLVLWLVGWTCRSERAQRMFVAGCFGVMGETGFAGALAVGLAHADLHVTPPLAWLGLTGVGVLSFFAAARRARGDAPRKLGREAWCGVASAVHVQGVDVDGEQEYGLGPLGLSVKWHGDKWDGDDEDPAFCSPEVSFVIGHAIAWAAVERYGARNWVELQAIFGGGGRRVCTTERVTSWLWMFDAVPGLQWLTALAPTNTTCEVRTLPRHARAICSRLGQRDIECMAPLTIEDLGAKIPTENRREWAAARVQAFGD